MQIGTHVSIAGGLFNAPANAAEVKAECFQIFSRSPHGGPVKDITKDDQKKFQAEMDKYGFKNFYIHTPYFINFSSAKPQTYYGSISVVRQELERGSLIGARAIMTHLGSFGDYTEKQGLQRVAEAVEKIMNGYKGITQLLLEISAGSGKIVGDTFEELAAILDNKLVKKYDVGVCLDTCHLFASGYDIRTKKGVDKTLKDFDKIVGFDRLVMVHSNDSKFELGKHLDRHENLGKGHIGLEGFKALAKHKIFGKLDWILETPKDDPKWDPENIAILNKIRK
jgi:deoxyribonuclease IV